MSATPRDLLHFLLSAVLAHPEHIQIDEKTDDLGILLSVTVDPTDMPTIIGKKWKTIESLRVILRIFSAKHNLRVNIKLVESPDGYVRTVHTEENSI